MRRVIFCLLVFVLVFGFMGGVFADSGSDDSDEDKSGSSGDSGKEDSDDDSSDDDSDMDDDEDEDDSDDENESDEDDDKNEVRVRVENEGEDSELRVETEYEEKDGESESKVKIKGYDEDGNEVEIEIETKMKDGEVVEKIKVKGYEVETELEVENESGELKVRLSNGSSLEVKVLPDVVSEKAIESFETRNISVELKEVGEGNNLSVVYEVSGNKTVKFLGLFKVEAQVRAVISAENGEVIETSEPWWYFLAFGPSSECSEDDLGLCGEDDCEELGLIWFNEGCVAECPGDSMTCNETFTVVFRNESLGCEFDACPVLSEEVLE